jgi:hypothetical protein
VDYWFLGLETLSFPAEETNLFGGVVYWIFTQGGIPIRGGLIATGAHYKWKICKGYSCS